MSDKTLIEAPPLKEPEKPKHSPIGASSRYRWVACPASIKRSEGLPNTAGAAALLGTAAHELAASCLENGLSHSNPEKLDELIKGIFDAVLIYAKYCQSLVGKNPYHIEHSFDMAEVYPGLYGTADFCCYDIENRVLHVVDYKNGTDLVVEVKDNLQLEYYALGALKTLGYEPNYVQMTIIQPRAYHPEGPVRHWKVPVIHFLDVEHDLVEQAKATEKKRAPAQAGSHCMFCPAKPECKTHGKYKTEVAGDVFDEIPKEGKTKKPPKPKRQYNFYSDPTKLFDDIPKE